MDAASATGATRAAAAGLRILVMSWEFPPRILGGLGRHVTALTTALASAGHDVVVVTAPHPGAPDHERLAGVEVVRVPTVVPTYDLDDELAAWVLDFNLRAAAAALGLCADRDFDVVHAHDWLVAPATVAVADVTGLPVVTTVHATEHGRHQGHLPGDRNHWIHQVEWWLAARSTRVITCSAFMRDQVQQLFDLDPDRLEVVPNGVDAARFVVASPVAAAARRDLARPDEVLVAYAGRLEWEKGVQDLLAAVPLVTATRGPVTLAIAGDGSQRASLEALAAHLGIADRVRFLGFMPPDRVATLYAAADVVAAPSLYEPFGMVAIEALAAGTPVVVGDTGGLAELVAAGMGTGVPPGDPEALASAISTLADDPGAARAMVARGRTALADHDWPTIADATGAILAAAAAGSPPDVDPEALQAGFRRDAARRTAASRQPATTRRTH